MRIDDKLIEQVRDRARIEDIVIRYVPSLKKKGKNFVGLCPFHKENTPSFTVTPEKQMFHCFGCNTGGNVFTFVSKVERLSFPESVRFVAQMVGMQIDDAEPDPESETRNHMIRINNYASEVYHRFLTSPQGVRGLEYLQKRGLTEDSIKTFKLGYAPDSWDFLTAKLTANKAHMPQAALLGIVSEKERERGVHYFDRFRDRVIFPIVDQYGQTVGFGGRVLGEGEPKYLNSPESLLYKKRFMLYGFNVAKPHIQELGRAIVVEGYLDVIGCHQAGIQNVVAPLGTALTEEQLRLISRYAGEVIIVFDSDSAGIKASLRSIEILSKVNISARIAMLPEDDPFDYVSHRGAREFMAVVDSALKPIEYQIERIFSGAEHTEKGVLLTQLFGVVNTVPFESEKDDYLRKIASRGGFDFNALLSDYKKFSSAAVHSFEAAVPAANEQKNRIHDTYRELIVLLCNHPELIEKARVDIAAVEITDVFLSGIYQKLGEIYSQNNKISADKLFDIFSNADEKRFVERYLGGSADIENPNAAYTEIYLKIKLLKIDEKIDNYFAVMRASSTQNRQDYLTEIEVLRREKEKLSSYLYNMHVHVV